jgi:hypothetical protein
MKEYIQMLISYGVAGVCIMLLIFMGFSWILCGTALIGFSYGRSRRKILKARLDATGTYRLPQKP